MKQDELDSVIKGQKCACSLDEIIDLHFNIFGIVTKP